MLASFHRVHRWIPISGIGAALLLLWLGIAGQHANASESLQTSQVLLVNATTGTATVTQLAPRLCRNAVVYAVWGAGTNAGVITVESAHTTTYAGTWASLGTITWMAATKADLLALTGVHGAIRTRISTTVTGGTVSTYYLCN